MILSGPQPVLANHLCNTFSCGEPSLDEWLKRRALANQSSGASRTFVVVDAENKVRAYYALTAGAVSHQEASSAICRNMPHPIPVLVLGRLAVDQAAQGMHVGAGLLRDAVHRATTVAYNTGVRALLVHALKEQAQAFYQYYGFQTTSQHPMTLMLCLAAK